MTTGRYMSIVTGGAQTLEPEGPRLKLYSTYVDRYEESAVPPSFYLIGVRVLDCTLLHRVRLLTLRVCTVSTPDRASNKPAYPGH
jgi:hypothetical protein